MGMERPVLVLSVPVREATDRIVVAWETLDSLEVVESADTLPAIERGILEAYTSGLNAVNIILLHHIKYKFVAIKVWTLLPNENK